MRLSTRKGTKVAKVCLPERVHQAAEAKAKKHDMSVTMFLSQLVTDSLATPKRERKQPA
jgi:hypothetical protein